MILSDINVLVYAFDPNAEDHVRYRAWASAIVNGESAYAVTDYVINGFVRVVTKNVFNPRHSLDRVLGFAGSIRNQPHAVRIDPGPRHWEIFKRLCVMTDARDKLIPDAYLAALAIEHGCEVVTNDRDFGRFPGLRWKHPLN